MGYVETLQLNMDFATKEIAVAPGRVMLSMSRQHGVKKLLILYVFPQHSQSLLGAHREGSLPFSAALPQTDQRPKVLHKTWGEKGDGDTLGGLGLLWPKAEAFVGHQFPLLTSCRSAAEQWLRSWGIAQTPQGHL